LGRKRCGNGCKFSFLIPLAPSSPLDPVEDPRNEAAKKILLVDDEPGMLRYIKTLLELDEFAVETASTGEEALGLLKGGSEPDLVLLDLLMPGIDGLQTFGTGAAMRPSVKVIMLSCVTDTRKVVQAIRLGASDYLTKPFQKAELDAVIEKCIEPKKMAYAGKWKNCAMTCFSLPPVRP